MYLTLLNKTVKYEQIQKTEIRKTYNWRDFNPN